MRRLLPISTLSLVLLLAGTVEAQPPATTLETRTALDGKLSLLVPQEFTLMSREMISKKYPRGNPPSLVFTNTQTTINVALDHNAFRVTVDELVKAKQAIRDAFAASFPTAQWFRDEVRSIKGRQFFLLDVRTPAVDTDVRNILVGTSYEGRLLVITFNVTKALEETWVPIGNRIIESVALKP
jgi:hypothetical protein